MSNFCRSAFLEEYDAAFLREMLRDMTSSDGVYPNGLFHSEGEGWKGMKKSRD
jgi:hypothetical protein